MSSSREIVTQCIHTNCRSSPGGGIAWIYFGSMRNRIDHTLAMKIDGSNFKDGEPPYCTTCGEPIIVHDLYCVEINANGEEVDAFCYGDLKHPKPIDYNALVNYSALEKRLVYKDYKHILHGELYGKKELSEFILNYVANNPFLNIEKDKK